MTTGSKHSYDGPGIGSNLRVLHLLPKLECFVSIVLPGRKCKDDAIEIFGMENETALLHFIKQLEASLAVMCGTAQRDHCGVEELIGKLAVALSSLVIHEEVPTLVNVPLSSVGMNHCGVAHNIRSDTSILHLKQSFLCF